MNRAIAGFLFALALAGCAGFPDGGRNLNGFPVDPSCYNFWKDDPLYGGNVALAYSTNCTAGGTGASR